LQMPGSILLMHTRWHESDLAGRLLEQMAKDPEADQWVVLNLPALVELGDKLHPKDPRGLGEALWPSRFDVDRLRKIRASIGPRWWNALYKGTPSGSTGNIFKRTYFRAFRDIDELGGWEAFDRLGFSLDLTFDEGAQADYVTIQFLGRTKLNIEKAMPVSYALIDQERAQVDFVDTMRLLQKMRDKYPFVKDLYIEIKANGAALRSVLKKSEAGKGLRIHSINPTTNKTLRYQAVAPILEQGRFYVNAYLPDLKGYIDEMCNVPLSKNDDQADATVQFILELESNGEVDPIKRLEKLKLLMR